MCPFICNLKDLLLFFVDKLFVQNDSSLSQQMQHPLIYYTHKDQAICKKMQVPFNSFSTKLFSGIGFLKNVSRQLKTP